MTRKSLPGDWMFSCSRGSRIGTECTPVFVVSYFNSGLKLDHIAI